MVIAEKSINFEGTNYTIRVSNLRQYTLGVAAVDVVAKRNGNTAIISEASVTANTPSGSTGGQSVGSPPSGRFDGGVVFFPASASTATLIWTGEFGTQTPTVEFSIEGLGNAPVSVCDYTQADGTIPNQIGGVPANDAITAVGKALPFAQDDVSTLVNAQFNNNPVASCVGSGGSPDPQQSGLSPVVIGLGILGAGAAAVALSQRDG